MFEVSSVGSSKLDAAEALRIRQSVGVSVAAHQYSMKNQMMRLLRRSKSAAQPPPEKMQTRHSHNGHHHYHHNHVVHPQNQQRNGGMVVNMVEGLPFIVGGKNKKVKKKKINAIGGSTLVLFDVDM